MVKLKLALSFFLGVGVSTSDAAVVSLSPTDIHGGNTATTEYSDAFLTLTPLIGSTPNTFNGNAARLGIDDSGTNVNAFNDPDTNPNNGNEERLLFEFQLGSGLTQFTYDFSRADGPGAEDGVLISGFTADPGITFSVSNPNLFAVYNAGTVRLHIPAGLFGGTVTEVNFDPSTSNGQTLNLSVTDTTQAGAQLAIRGISYENAITAIPEPSSFAVLTLLFSAVRLRRRRKA